MATKTVTGAVVGKGSVTLFFLDGSSEVLPQETFRTAEILEQIGPALAKGEHFVMELQDFVIARQVAELTKGAVTVTETTAGEVNLTVKGVEVPAEALIPHIERAVADGSKGFAAFMRKYAEIQRKHSAKELLDFMKEADLPITDDGSILGYKVLRQREDGVLVDPHSRKVTQKLGSLVFMPESKVDDNRRVACSTGLHIAARSYLPNFWGGEDRTLCLVKIQPKDVIAVPINETSKMRVSAYHIIKVLDDKEANQLVRHNISIHELTGAAKLLAEAVAGNHTPIIETVQVRGLGDIVVTPIAASKIERMVKARKLKVEKSVTPLKKLPSARSLVGPRMEPRDIRLLNKLIRNKPHLADQDPKYLKKLVKAQRMLDDGNSLRKIAEKLAVDRDGLGRNLIREAA